MNYFVKAIRFESTKAFSCRALWIVFGIVIAIQPFLAFVSAMQLSAIGITATPETHPQLAVALPPVDYFGFDLIPLGQVAIVVLGCMMGASEFRNRELRTTLICLNKRANTFVAKLTVMLIYSSIVSMLSIFTTIAVTHIGLGNQGLHPIILSPTAWLFIAYSVLDWVLLILLSFGIGVISRNAIIPIVLIIPQCVGLGGLLAEKWSWGSYLPVAAGNLLFASPTDIIIHDPIKGGIVLFVWTAAVLSVATFLFVRRDVRGNH